MGRPKPASPLIPHRGPIIAVDEKYSWRKHVEYPVSSSSPFWKSPSPPSASPQPGKPRPTKDHKPPKYAYYHPSSPLSRNFEDWNSPEYAYDASSVRTPDGPKIRHCGDAVRASYGAPPRLFVDEIKPKVYWGKAGRQAYVEKKYYASTEEGESEASRRMRVAREVDEQMRADEEMLKQKQRVRRSEAEKAHWEMRLDREREMRRESERKIERAHWEMQVAREQTGKNKNTWEGNEWERVQVVREENVGGLGVQGLEHESWERVPVVRPKPKARPEYGLRYQNPEDYEEWKLEIHNPVKGKNRDKGVMRKPQRWIEVREKPEGKVEVVMVRRRKPRY